MDRRLALALLACAGLVVGAAGCGDDKDKPALKKQTLTLTERDTNDFGYADNPPKTTLGDAGPKATSSGDQVTFRSDITRGGKDVGDLLATCTIVHGGAGLEQSSATCQGTIELPEGTLFISVGGAKTFGNSVTGAVTGGTGKYAGATGTFKSSDSSSNGSKDTLEIWVPED